MELAEISYFGGPVVFLKIDVGGVVGAPRWKHGFVPEALEIGGHAHGAGAADEQITAKLEVELLKVGIGGVCVEIVEESAVGGHGIE